MKRCKTHNLRMASISVLLSLVLSLSTASADAIVSEEVASSSSLIVGENIQLPSESLLPRSAKEETIITQIDEAADFDPQEILVVLKQGYGGINKAHTPDDFPEIPCAAVEDLTALPEDVGTLEYLNVTEFHQILLLTLSTSTKEEVIAAIRTLEEREDILSAEPNYKDVAEPCAVPNDPSYGSQWGLEKNPSSLGLEYHQRPQRFKGWRD